MKDVIIYTKAICPYCDRAKALFDKLVIAYTEIDISTNTALREAMIQRAGGRTTVPQIFIGDHHVGGFDDLYALYRTGELETVLQKPAGNVLSRF